MLPFIWSFENTSRDHHEPKATPGGLDSVQVQRMARLALATVW